MRTGLYQHVLPDKVDSLSALFWVRNHALVAVLSSCHSSPTITANVIPDSGKRFALMLDPEI